MEEIIIRIEQLNITTIKSKRKREILIEFNFTKTKGFNPSYEMQ
ncbi:MAG: hypothetical protein R2680_13060 [Nitrososphaeraceae archaeon]